MSTFISTFYIHFLYPLLCPFYVAYFSLVLLELMNQTEIVGIPVEQDLDQNFTLLGFPIHYFALAIVGLFLLAYLKMAGKNKKLRNKIALIGERNSGKTQLFISLNGGKKMKTAPSIHNNKTDYELNGKKYQMVDFIGDNISKE